MNTDAWEETFRQALKQALGEAVREEWDEMASHHVRHPVSLRCRLKMKRILSGRSVRQTNRTLAKKIGIGILVALAVFAMLGMAIPPVREAVVKMIITWYDECFGVRYEVETDEPIPTVIEEVILPAWLPEGWKLERVYSEKMLVWHELSDENGNSIDLEQIILSPDHETTWFDNTDVEIETVLLNSHTKAQLFTYADGGRILTWVDRYEFILTGYADTGGDADILIRIAESMKQKGKS